MNKRQTKKKNKIINERAEFFNNRIIMSGRMNHKTYCITDIYIACKSKSYKNFKLLKKKYDKLFMSVDWSNGKDYSIMTSYKIKKNGAREILNSEVLC